MGTPDLRHDLQMLGQPADGAVFPFGGSPVHGVSIEDGFHQLTEPLLVRFHDVYLC
jgi:hypothetical protein